MRTILRHSLTSLWVLFATVFLARWWLGHPDAMPSFPTYFWVWITDLFGAQNAEDVANVEMWVALCVAFIFVVAITFSSWFVWHRVQNALTHHSTRTR